MAKKFVRGVTGVDDIEKFDKTLTNVNDIISDGENTYVHTKKGKVENYYNLTDSVKTIQSSGETIAVEKNDDGELKLDINPQKVLEHDNLLTDYGISKTTSGNTTMLGIEYTRIESGIDLDNFVNGRVRSNEFTNAPAPGVWYLVSAHSDGDFIFQEAITLVDDKNKTFRRVKYWGVWTPWREQVGDKSVIDGLLAQKQNTLTNNTSIGVNGSGLQQLYAQKQTYNVSGGLLKTHVKSVSENTRLGDAEEEFNFTVKINQNAENIVVNLNEHDKTAFTKIMTTYGSNNIVNIYGCVFTLSDSSLTVSTTNNTNQNYVITFSDII